jgi:hypothetical protein
VAKIMVRPYPQTGVSNFRPRYGENLHVCMLVMIECFPPYGDEAHQDQVDARMAQVIACQALQLTCK